MTMPITHDALAHDLAKWLKSGAEHWCWENCTLGEWSGARPDVIAYRRHRYTAPTLKAFEIKVSRADLLSDLRAEKWRKYLEHCGSVTFAMPAGMAKADEIPSECGVMYRSARGWSIKRRAKDIGNPASVVAMAKLMTVHPLAARGSTTPEAHYKAEASVSRKFGREVAAYLREVAQGVDPVERARAEGAAEAAKQKREVDGLWLEIKGLLAEMGIPAADARSAMWQVRRAVERLSVDKRIEAASLEIASAANALARAQQVFADLASAGEVREARPIGDVVQGVGA